MVAPEHSEVYQLAKIRRAVPSYVQPELNNLKKMDMAWEVLEEVLGNVMESVHRLVERRMPSTTCMSCLTSLATCPATSLSIGI